MAVSAEAPKSGTVGCCTGERLYLLEETSGGSGRPSVIGSCPGVTDQSRRLDVGVSAPKCRRGWTHTTFLFSTHDTRIIGAVEIIYTLTEYGERQNDYRLELRIRYFWGG